MDEALARAFTIGGSIFVAVRNPKVGNAGLAKALSDGCADVATGDSVIDPELTNGFVSMRESKAIGCFGMGKERGIEIEAESA